MDTILKWRVSMNKKLAIFPISRTVCPIIRYSQLLNEYQLVSILAPDFLRLDGQDICCLDGGDPTKLYIETYSEKSVLDCDAIYLTYTNIIEDINVYKNVIGFAKDNRKEIILSEELQVKIGEYKPIETEEDFNLTLNVYKEKLFNINVPIISIMNMGNYCDQQNIELSIYKHFSEKNYKVTLLTSKEQSKFFGFKNLPDFIYKDMDTHKKIILFNHYIKALVKNEKSDLLIISIPDAMMKHNNDILNGMGIVPYVITNAVNIDVNIISVYCNQYKRLYFEELMNYSQYRFNVPAMYFNIANTIAKVNAGIETELDYIFVDSKFVLSKNDLSMGGDSFRLFNVLDERSTNDIYNAIEDELTGNANVLK